MKTKKILITGSNGLLGQKLVYQLANRDLISLIATARGANRLLKKDGYTYYEADITDFERFNNVIAIEKPDYIIHTAAMTNVDACEADKDNCWKLNVLAVENICKQCEIHKIHLIHLSTDFIFDGTHGPLDENETPNPLSYYGHSKWEAEKLVMKLNSPWAILRTVLVYGIVDNMSRSNIVLWVKESLEQGKNIRVVDDQFRTPTFAEDLAMACELAVLKNAKGIYNISGGEYMSIYELVEKVADYYRLDKSLIERTDSTTLNQPAKRPPKTGFIIDKAKKELGFQPTSFIRSLEIMDEQIANHSKNS